MYPSPSLLLLLFLFAAEPLKSGDISPHLTAAMSSLLLASLLLLITHSLAEAADTSFNITSSECLTEEDAAAAASAEVSCDSALDCSMICGKLGSKCNVAEFKNRKCRIINYAALMKANSSNCDGADAKILKRRELLLCKLFDFCDLQFC